MDKQWSLYSVSSLVLIILLKLTMDQGHVALSIILGLLLLVQMTGTTICVYRKKHQKKIPTSK